MIFFYLLPFQAAAVVCDLGARKIPNALITGGAIMGGAYQWSTNGPMGLVRFAGGTLTPLLLLGVLHCFRMLGAGDIKLLMMTGGFFGVRGSVRCVCAAFLAAGIYALAVAARRRLLKRRLQYLIGYMRRRKHAAKWEPYIEPQEEEVYLYFSIPVLVGTLAVMGGIL